MEDRSPALLGSSIPLLVTSWTTFLLRVWVRGILLRTWGIDDWLMACSITCFTAYNISEGVGITYGTGKHIRDLEPSRAQTALITWWLCELLYIGCTVFLKLSVGVFLHRIAINRWHVWIIRVMTVCTGVFGFAYFFVGVFMCRPVQSWWIRKHSLESKDYGSCISDDAVVGLTFAAGALNSIADFTFALIPFFMIKDLRMPKKSKRLVAGILTFANIACIATIIRMPYILDLYKTDDWLFATVNMVVWCSVECGVGITAACFATLRPLLRIFFGIQASQWFPDQHPLSGRIDRYTSNVQDPSGSTGDSYTLDSALPKLRPDHVGHYTEISSAESKQSRGRTRERKDPRITGRLMRDLYSKTDDKEEKDDSGTGTQVPAGVTGDRGAGATSPTLEIRKDFEFSYSVKERNEDELDEFQSSWRPPPAGWHPETAAQYARNIAGVTKAAREENQPEDDGVNLTLQTHGLDK